MCVSWTNTRRLLFPEKLNDELKNCFIWIWQNFQLFQVRRTSNDSTDRSWFVLVDDRRLARNEEQREISLEKERKRFSFVVGFESVRRWRFARSRSQSLRKFSASRSGEILFDESSIFLHRFPRRFWRFERLVFGCSSKSNWIVWKREINPNWFSQFPGRKNFLSDRTDRRKSSEIRWLDAFADGIGNVSRRLCEQLLQNASEGGEHGSASRGVKQKRRKTFLLNEISFRFSWIHAVYTVTDSLVFGGNFLHSMAVDMQLRFNNRSNLSFSRSNFVFS